MAEENRVKQSDEPNPNYTYDTNFTPNTYRGGALTRNWDGTVATKPTWGMFGKEFGKSVLSAAGLSSAEKGRPAGTGYWDARRRMPDYRLATEIADRVDHAGENPGVTIEQVRARNAAARGEKPQPTPTSTTPEQNLDYSGMAGYGLGGAGAGALLGAALGRKGRRGQSALIGAGLGGGAGLLAHYLANQKKASHIDPAFIAPLAGAAVGGGVGALTDKKHRLRNALIGAGLGGAAGGAAEYALPGVGLGAKYTVNDIGLGLKSHLTNKPLSFFDKAKLLTGRAGEIAEYGMRRHSGLPGLELAYLPRYLDKKSADKQADLPGLVAGAGARLSNAYGYLKGHYDKLPEAVRSGIGMGGLGGAAAGGLAGLVAPGEDVEYDGRGRVVKRNPRSRFGAMVRGALGGGALGAAGGAAAGHFAPQPTQQAADYFRQQSSDFYNKINPVTVNQATARPAPAGMQA